MADVVLHIGAGKCGSSAIQTALTRNPALRKDNGSFLVYGVIDANGQLLRGAQLQPTTNIRGYCASEGPLHRFDEQRLVNISCQLADVKAETIVFSNESWLHQSKRLTAVLPYFGKPVRIVAYVRPPVSFLNSAWWQWGAWQDMRLEDWVKQRLRSTFWDIPLRSWTQNPHVCELIIRPLKEDIVGDFFALLGVTKNRPANVQINSGLPAPILRLFQKHSQLRKNSQIDFVLAKRLQSNGSAPWVLHRDAVRFILKKTKAHNHELLKLLAPDTAQEILEDARWWRASAFADRKVEASGPVEADATEIEKLCLDMALAIFRSEKEIHLRTQNSRKVPAPAPSSSGGRPTSSSKLGRRLSKSLMRFGSVRWLSRKWS